MQLVCREADAEFGKHGQQLVGAHVLIADLQSQPRQREPCTIGSLTDLIPPGQLPIRRDHVLNDDGHVGRKCAAEHTLQLTNSAPEFALQSLPLHAIRDQDFDPDWLP
jgi:hypothetical protein